MLAKKQSLPPVRIFGFAKFFSVSKKTNASLTGSNGRLTMKGYVFPLLKQRTHHYKFGAPTL
jgi:hypothetical protein